MGNTYFGIYFFEIPYIIYMAVGQNLVPLVNIKIAGKWMFIPLKMVLIGIDPYPYNLYILHILVLSGIKISHLDESARIAGSGRAFLHDASSALMVDDLWMLKTWISQGFFWHKKCG